MKIHIANNENRYFKQLDPGDLFVFVDKEDLGVCIKTDSEAVPWVHLKDGVTVHSPRATHQNDVVRLVKQLNDLDVIIL